MTDQKRQRPVAVREALEGYLSRSGLTRRLAQARVITEWPGLVGAQIAAVTRPESVTPDGTLFVRVRSSAWMTELQLMAPEILARLNGDEREAGGARRIKTIRWLLGS